MEDDLPLECNSQSDPIRTEDGILVRKLYVGNIPHLVSRRQLEDIFQQFGQIQNVYINKIPNNLAPRVLDSKHDNYGFITYYEPESATKALNYQRAITLKYKRLKVKSADTWHQPIEQPHGVIKFDNGEIFQFRTSPAKHSYSHHLDDESSLGAVGGVVKLPIEEIKDTDSNACKIEILNDYCLLKIFSYMSIFDDIKLEKVCLRWSALIHSKWNTIRVLDIDHIIKSLDPMFTTDMLRKCLLRCGMSIKSIKLSSTCHNLNMRTHRIISQYCKNLEVLDLSGIATTGSSITFIARNCNKLKKIYFKDISGVHDNIFDELFANNQNLESVNLDRNFAMTGKCLRHLTSKLKELKLIHCNSLKLVDLKTGLRKITSLELLSLDSCVTITSIVLTEIVTILPNLKTLSLNNYYPLMNNESLNAIQNLKQLTCLSLSMNQAINNEVLQKICNSCQDLETLDISGSDLIGDIDDVNEPYINSGLFHVAQLPKLSDLTVNYMQIVNTDSTRYLAAKGLLRKLKVRGCPHFNDNTALQMIQSCPNLIYLDMSGCERITEDTIMHALNILNLQLDRVQPLELVIGGTSINADYQQHHRMLDISTENYCLRHFRPDYSDDYFPPGDSEYDPDNMYCDPDDVDCISDFDPYLELYSDEEAVHDTFEYY